MSKYDTPERKALWESHIPLRDYFAGQALIALIESQTDYPCGEIAMDAYLYADAMMRERQE